jgi:RNA polymerase sigma-70 factor (ECF subfamily)
VADPSLPADDPDAALVVRARSAPDGDTRAFDELMVRHRSRVVANCRYLTSGNDAEDLAQEVLVKAYFALRRYESRARFSTWLYRIKVNHCLNHRRAERRRQGEMTLDDAAPDAAGLTVAPEADVALDRAADVSRVRAAVAGLPETLRQALILRELDEMSYEEIAAALGVSLSAVKMRILRARQELHVALGAERG